MYIPDFRLIGILLILVMFSSLISWHSFPEKSNIFRTGIWSPGLKFAILIKSLAGFGNIVILPSLIRDSFASVITPRILLATGFSLMASAFPPSAVCRGFVAGFVYVRVTVSSLF